jgi:deoxyribose-phosphate aldolase
MSLEIDATKLAVQIEHTLLRPDADRESILRLCTEAREHKFHAVCVQGSWVAEARHALEGSSIQVVTVAGFPLGGSAGDAKRFETEVAVDDGAHEIDVVMNVGRLKSGDDRYVLREMRDVIEAADERPVKVILETCLLSREEKIRACRLAIEAGAAFVITSTGFSTGGATVDDVRLLVEAVNGECEVKAAGGIRDARFALALIDAGATRLGTSAGVQIITDAQ